MFARVMSFGVSGMDGYPVGVEVDTSGGLPQFAIVGLPDSAVKESSERVRSAVKNLKYPWPASRITVNLNIHTYSFKRCTMPTLNKNLIFFFDKIIRCFKIEDPIL